MVKKFLCILLLLCMLLPMTVACSNKGDGEESHSVSDVDSIENSDSDVNPSNAPVPMMDDFQDYKFRVLTRGGGLWLSDDITGQITGTRVSVATYKRNAALKAKYNFEIVEDKQVDWNAVINRTAPSGENVYDMYSIRLRDIPVIGQEGYVMNLNEVDGLNLDAEYFDQSTRADGSFANYLFFLTGDMIYNDDASAAMMAFNFDLWDEYRLQEKYGKDLYQLVKDNEWTFEKMTTLAKLAVGDKNGDGKMEDLVDYYGCTVQNATLLCFSIGMDNKLLRKDAEDMFYFEPDATIVNDLQTIIEFWHTGATTTILLTPEDAFMSGRALFATSWLQELPDRMLNSGVDYGIIPMPMKEEGTYNYHSMCQTYGSNCITICSSVPDPDKTANIIELISYESMSTLTPALNEWMFEGRAIQHAADLEMVDIICETKCYELCNLWMTGSLYDTVKDLATTNGTGISSSLEQSKGNVNAAVSEMLKKLNQLA